MTHVNLLTSLEATKGETLTSAVLAYLLKKNIKLIKAFEIGGVSVHEHEQKPKIEREFKTKNDADESGFLDLYIELKNRYVIGIENKIWATFQKNQPLKYCDTLIERANANGNSRAILVVLAPETYKNDICKINKECADQNKEIEFVPVYWEKLIENLKGSASGTDNFIVQQLEEFVDQDLDFKQPFQKVYKELYNEAGQWNQFHDELVKKIWHLFDDPGPRIEKSKDRYCGYRFFRKWDRPEREYVYGWYGFVNQKELGNKSDGTNLLKFIIVTTLPNVELPDCCLPYFEKAIFPEKIWPERCTGWIINFDRDWNNLGQLRDIISRLNEELYRRLPPDQSPD